MNLTDEPNPVDGIAPTADFDEAEELAREIRTFDGVLHGLMPVVRAEKIERRTACIHRLTWLLLLGVPLP